MATSCPFFNALKYVQTGCDSPALCKVLELGCGAGNNLWFFAEQGYDVFGVDGSQTAVGLALKALESRNVVADVQHAYFSKLPFEKASMDVVVDRESIYCGTKENIELSLKEANRVLKKGGVFISFRFSDKNPSLSLLEQGKIIGKKLEENTWSDISHGTFAETGVVHFSSIDELEQQHTFLDLKYINEHTNKTIRDYSKDNEFFYSKYILVGVKK